MGRGLSNLQHFILKKTAKQGVLFRWQVKEDFFHWRPVKPIPRWRRPQWQWRRLAQLQKQPSKLSRKFVERKCQLGLPPPTEEELALLDTRTYENRMSTSIARCLTRLERRGLIVKLRVKYSDTSAGFHWEGIVLSVEGRRYVKQQFGIKARKMPVPEQWFDGQLRIWLPRTFTPIG